MNNKKMFYDMGDGVFIDLSKVTGFKQINGKYILAFGDSLNPIPYVFEERDFHTLLVHLRISRRALPGGIKPVKPEPVAPPTVKVPEPPVEVKPLRKSRKVKGTK